MIIERLTQKFEDLSKKNISEDVIIISLKEELQHYLLHFIYTSKEYSFFVMYGGTVLRIGYNLPRMSEDLDFQIGKEINLEKFAKDLKKYFYANYNLKIETQLKINKSGINVVVVKFDILKNSPFKSIVWTKLKIRIDINFFEGTNSFIKNIIPITRDTLVYTIRTYPLSTLMASKAIAFFKRDTRGIGKIITNIKPRDVYDMMWYMEQRIIPDLEYLEKWDFEFKNFLDFRDKVKLRLENIQEKAFKDDLAQFFLDEINFENWLQNWKIKFLHLLNLYEIFEIEKLHSIYFRENFDTGIKKIVFKYYTSSKSSSIVKFEVKISELWLDFKGVGINRKLSSLINSSHKTLTSSDYECIFFFYKKVQNYIKRNKGVVYQNTFVTKTICTASEKLNPREEICLNKNLLKKIDFEELC